MRLAAILLLLSIVIFSCGSAKKAQKVQAVTATKVDTPLVVVAADTNTRAKLPSNDVFGKIVNNKTSFATFNAKARVEYESKEGSDDATAFIRLKKDSALWLSLRGALGIEGFRVLITKDSVKVMDLLKKNIQLKDISYLQEMTGIPLDFSTLQDLVIGNPVFIDPNIVSSTIDNNQLQILMEGKLFRNLLSLDTSNFKIVNSKLENVEVGRTGTINLGFGNYEITSGVQFATTRKMAVTEQSTLTINLDFKQYSFNQPLTFPFNIPKNYKKL